MAFGRAFDDAGFLREKRRYGDESFFLGWGLVLIAGGGGWLACGHCPQVFDAFLIVLIDAVELLQHRVLLELGEAFEQL